MPVCKSWMPVPAVAVAAFLSLGMELHAAGPVTPVAASAPVAAPKPISADEPVLLKYGFQPNQVVHYQVVHKTSIVLRKGRAQQTSRSELTTDKHLQVVSVAADNIATLDSTIDRIQATVQFDDDGANKYDSSTGEDPPAPLKNVKGKIGKSLARMQFSPTGELVKTEMLEQPGDHSAPSADESSTDPSGKNFLITMPAAPIRIGESWKDPFTVNVNVPPNLQTPVTINRKYTLKSIENGIATISLETTIITPVNNPAVLAQLIQRTPVGTILFDIKKGLITGRTLTTDETVHEFAGGGSEMRAQSSLVETIVNAPAVATKVGVEIGPSPR